jgi:carboxylesterase type B
LGAVVDGRVLVEDPAETVAAGRQNDVPTITGLNADEGSASSRQPVIPTAGGSSLARVHVGAPVVQRLGEQIEPRAPLSKERQGLFLR